MRHAQQQAYIDCQSVTDSESTQISQQLGESSSFDINDLTIDCYNRRSRILADAFQAEWWVAIAVLLMIVGMGFVAL